jgi:hypothetical protein
MLMGAHIERAKHDLLDRMAADPDRVALNPEALKRALPS